MTGRPRLAGRVGLVADDLTGAADAAGALVCTGGSAAVCLAGDPPAGADVLALVTDSRGLPAGPAGARTAAAVAALRRWGADWLYVKIDSTLRGPVAATVGAALASWPAGPALACPALPAQGRRVRGGVLRAPGWPDRAVAAALPAVVPVADAETDAQLRAVAETVLRRRAVAVGSAGLAGALAGFADFAGRAPELPVASGVLVVCGSGHPASREQVEALRAAGALAVRWAGDPAAGPAAPGPAGPAAPGPAGPAADPDRPAAGPDAAGALAAAGRALAGGRLVLLTAPAGSDRRSGLAAAAVALLATAPAAGLVLTGGDTALAVAKALGASVLWLAGEVEPGVPVGRLDTAAGPLPVVTKSGGFGGPDLLVRAAGRLTAAGRLPASAGAR